MRWVTAGDAATLAAMTRRLGRRVREAVAAAAGEEMHVCSACFVVVCVCVCVCVCARAREVWPCPAAVAS